MLCMSVKTYGTKWPLRIINSKGAGMFEYFFFYSITNRKNRISDNEEEDNNEEDSEGEDSEGEDSQADLESVSDTEVDAPSMSYS
jgi:hypothetical protein